MIEGVLKAVGNQLIDLTLDNVGLWDYMNIRHMRRHNNTPHGVTSIQDERINLFELGILAPNLKRLCLEMGHYIFDDSMKLVKSSNDSCKCDNGIVRFEPFPSLEVLHIKGINSTSSQAVKEMLCRCHNLEELILLTKPPHHGALSSLRQRFRAENEYELCSIINEGVLADILQINPMRFLKTFIASTVNPCPSGCRLQLSDRR